MAAIDEKKKIINIPRPLAVLAGIIIEKNIKKKGLQGGLDARFLMRDIMTQNLYFDPEDTAKKLRYNRGGIREAITSTMRACYPEQFEDK